MRREAIVAILWLRMRPLHGGPSNGSADNSLLYNYDRPRFVPEVAFREIPPPTR